MAHSLSIGIFGLIGVFSRFILDQWIQRIPLDFPIGILSINLIGSFLAGLLFVFGNERSLLPPSLTLGLLVGFCGSFTTFSTYSLQSLQLFEKAEILRGLFYFLISPILGLFGAFAGTFVARHSL